MEISVLDTNFVRFYIVEDYESIIWNDRYSTHGDFELYTRYSNELITNLKPGRYLKNSESEHLMIIEDLSIETDPENGNHIKFIGRSLESILDRRIIFGEHTIKKNANGAIKKLIYDCFIKPNGGAHRSLRKVSNMVYVGSSNKYFTKTLKMDDQFDGDNLLEVIEAFCETNEIGFKLLLEDGNFVFYLYKGEEKAGVKFSPDFDNILESNYVETHSTYKNVAIVKAAGDDNTRLYVPSATSGKKKAASGLDRREIYVQTSTSQDDMSDEDYLKVLKTDGNNALTENAIKKEFDGKCDTYGIFQYGKDFNLGDIVTVENEYGIRSKAIVNEFTWSQNSEGYDTYPTFKAPEKVEVERDESDNSAYDGDYPFEPDD